LLNSILAGKILTGGKVLTDGEYGKGYFCAPTLAELPYDHRLWKVEMFLPIATVGKFTDREEAMRIANEVNYGLTAGFYGGEDEFDWFFDKIEAGVTYANRPPGLHNRSMARLSTLRRVERLGFIGQEFRWSSLPAALHA